MEVTAVLFTQRTDGGKLAENLRKEDEAIVKQCGHRVKIVETSG